MKNVIRTALVGLAALGTSLFPKEAEAQGISTAVGVVATKTQGGDPTVTYWIRPSKTFKLGKVGSLPVTLTTEGDIGVSSTNRVLGNYFGVNSIFQTTKNGISYGIKTFNHVKNPFAKKPFYMVAPYPYVSVPVGKGVSLMPSPGVNAVIKDGQVAYSPTFYFFVTKKMRNYSITAMPIVGATSFGKDAKMTGGVGVFVRY